MGEGIYKSNLMAVPLRCTRATPFILSAQSNDPQQPNMINYFTRQAEYSTMPPNL